MRRLTGRRALPWLAAGLTLVVLLVYLNASSPRGDEAERQPDPRAYPISSTDISLQDALTRAEITLPECQNDDLRFALIDNGFGYYFDIYLKFGAGSVNCINDFLAANKMVDTFQATEVGGGDAERPLSRHRQWIDSEPVRRMGWQLGWDQKFQQFAVTSPAMYLVTALVQRVPDTPNVQAYVYAFRGG